MEIITVRLGSRGYGKQGYGKKIYGKRNLLQGLAIILECEPYWRHQAG
jgi:hypothetical protein